MRYRLCYCGAVRDDRHGAVCPRCGAGAKRERRNTKQYGYDNAWRKLSERVRKEQPLCQTCEKDGIVTPAEDVHHVVPIDEAPWLRLDRSNLMAVCKACHQKIHESGHRGERGGDV